MSIIKNKRSIKFTTLPNDLLNDTRLDWRDAGLLNYLLSKPESWEIRVNMLAKQRKTGRDGIYAILKRLRECGYARYVKFSDGRTEWHLSDEATFGSSGGQNEGNSGKEGNVSETLMDKPYTANPDLDPNTANPDQANPDLAKPDDIVNTERAVKTEKTKKTEEAMCRSHDPQVTLPKNPEGDIPPSSSQNHKDQNPVLQKGEVPDEPSPDNEPYVVPPCPHQKIIDLYHKHLPMGIQIREWNEKRQKHLRARWREKRKRQNIDWWDRFFAHCARSRFLTGKAQSKSGRPFEVKLPWLLQPETFANIIEGVYHE